MKKILKSKKTLATLSVLLVLAIVSGATYAWFTSSATAENTSVNMGELEIRATFDAETDLDILYEPGTTARKTGTVTNAGTLAFIAKLELDGEVTIYRNADGSMRPNPYTARISGIDGIDVTVSQSSIDEYYDDDGMYDWFIHPDTGDIYIVMENYNTLDKMEANLQFVVTFGGNLDNRYQGAEISYTKGWQATQYMDDAFEAMFGFDIDDLEYYIGYTAPTTGRVGVAAADADVSIDYTTRALIDARLAELRARS